MASSSASTPLAPRHIASSMSAPDLLADMLRGASDDEDDNIVSTPVEPDASWRPFRPPIGLVTPERTPSPGPASEEDGDGLQHAETRRLPNGSGTFTPLGRRLSPAKVANGSASPLPQPRRTSVTDTDAEETDPEDDGSDTIAKPGANERQLRRHASEPYRPPSPPFEDGRAERMGSVTFSREETPIPQSEDEPGSPNSAFASPLHSLGRRRLSHFSFSLWDYLHREVVAHEGTEGRGNPDFRAERISNFLNVPIAIEKIVFFGWVICFDAFLHTFTILPLRVAVATVSLLRSYFDVVWWSVSGTGKSPRRRLRVSHKIDLIKGLLLFTSCIVLHRLTDASQMYHSVRGQETIKLYVIFNVLEIADRLCCSFGQDVLDSLFSPATLGRRVDGSQPHLRPAFLFALAFVFTVAHTLVLFYQLVCLNVAINSYDNALLTLLLSNQFVEIKGSVFKKFEKENLFQMSCADIVERFQLWLMLVIVTLRNLIELSGSNFSHLPTSFALFPSLSLLQTIVTPAATVLMSEMIVDWLKHAFITKFNHIRPAVYGRFMDILCRDLVTDNGAETALTQPFVDQSPMVSRRLGFAVLPFGCLIIRMTFQALDMLSDVSHIDECAPPSGRSPVRRGGLANLFLDESVTAAMAKWSLAALVTVCAWACLVALKLLIGINLRAYAATRFATQDQRAQEDALNGRDRKPIGVALEETVQDRRTLEMINGSEFDASTKPAPGVKIAMEDLSRFDMVRSRIM